MCQLSVFQDAASSMSSLSWPRSGTMRSGRIYEQPTSALPTNANASSSWPTTRTSCGGYSRDGGVAGKERPTLEGASQAWPTPSATEGDGDPGTVQARRQRMAQKHNNQNGFGLNLAQATGAWPSPRAEDSESAGNHPNATDSLTGATKDWQTPGTDSFRSRGGNRKDEMGLDQQARTQDWATPNVPNRGPEARQKKKKRGSGGEDLQTQAGTWPTPNCPAPHDSENTVGLGRGPRDGYGKMLQDAAAAPWMTPQARDHKSGESIRSTTELYGRRSPPLSHQAPRTDLPGSTSSSSGPTSRPRLNPAFTCWLMGWPWWWTSPAPISFAAPAMASWRTRLLLHLSCLLGERG